MVSAAFCLPQGRLAHVLARVCECSASPWQSSWRQLPRMSPGGRSGAWGPVAARHSNSGPPRLSGACNLKTPQGLIQLKSLKSTLALEQETMLLPGAVVHTCSPSTPEAEAGGSPGAQGQARLYSESLSQKNQTGLASAAAGWPKPWVITALPRAGSCDPEDQARGEAPGRGAVLVLLCLASKYSRSQPRSKDRVGGSFLRVLICRTVAFQVPVCAFPGGSRWVHSLPGGAESSRSTPGCLTHASTVCGT